jgi:hypothetical protein
MIARRQPRHLIALWVIGALLLSGLLLFFTPRGLGMSPDSVAYLKSVQGLFQGMGFAYFSVQWPPLYSLLIALAAQAIGDDFYLGSRMVNSVLYGALFILTGALLRQIAASFSYLAYFFAGSVLLHPLTTHIYFYAFSEALFLPLVILNFILLGGLVSTNQKFRWQLVIALAVVAFAANLARYAGLCLIALNVLALYLSDTRGNKWQKFGDILCQILPTLLFLIIWRQRLGIGDTETNLRPFIVHLITLENINQGLVNIGHWLIPFIKLHEVPSIRPIYWGLGAALLSFILIVAIETTVKVCNGIQKNKPPATALWARFLLAIFSSGYLVFLILMRSFFDPNIILDNRTLAPIFLPVFVLVISYLLSLTSRSLRAFGLTLFAGLLILSLQTIRPWLLINYFNGVELSDKSRLNNELVKFVRSCPRDIRIYADKPWHFNLEVQSMVHWLPTEALYGSWQPNTRYQEQVTALSSLADLVIIEESRTSIASTVATLGAFQKLSDTPEGMVWANVHSYNRACLQSP